MPTRISYRSVFISDVHLGSRGCRARDLKSFLKRIDCENLYLVGDIIDMWRLRQRWHWPAEHNDVARTILKLAKRGARVTYIPGNHDEHARQFIGLTFGDVRIRKNAVHTTADGRKLLVTHGDEADLIITHARLLSKVGAWAYDTLIAINTKYNHLRAMMGLEYWSLSRHIKLKVKSACTFIARFEETLMAEARNKGFQGVVCGHIHKAEHRTDGDTLYFNCGDWVEGGTALVEHDDGTLQVIDAIALTNQLKAQEQALKDAAATKTTTTTAPQNSPAPAPEFRPRSTSGVLIAAK